MKLTLAELKDKSKWQGYKIFEFDHEKVRANTQARPEWIHFGGGNIFRIFPAGLCQRLLNSGDMDTGIVVADSYDFEIVDLLFKPHDCLTLGVTLKSDGTIQKEIIGSVVEAVKVSPEQNPDWEILEKAFTNKSLKMISFTITEKGYALYDANGNLLKAYEEDFKRGPKNATMLLCHITRLLLERFNAGKLPLAVVSMDNCSHNGEKLGQAIFEIAENWQKNGFVGKDFVDYVKDETKISFPWSMIDKITPRPDSNVAQMLEKDGFEETKLIVTKKNTYCATFVNAEEPQYLVIEDKFPNGRPPLEKAGVYLTDRQTVNKVEQMKVCTCLNPLHTALALSGCLLGFKLICDEMKDADLNKMTNILAYDEGLPVVVDPKILNPKDFIEEVITKRLPNPFMPDTPQRIATDTSQKLAIRFGETVKAYTLANKKLDELKIIPLVYAMWLRYLMGMDDELNQIELSPDPLLEAVKPFVAKIKIGSKRAEFEGDIKKLLQNEKIFGYNLADSQLYDKVLTNFEKMLAGKGAIRKTISEVIA